jgi:hypothetical protein
MYGGLQLLIGLVITSSALTMRPALAGTRVYLPDISQLEYQLYPGGLIYFRNLSDFSSAALYGDYNYSIDTTSQDGRDTRATMLSRDRSAIDAGRAYLVSQQALYS